MILRQEARRQRLRSRTTRCMIEVQNDAMGDRASEKSGPTAVEKSNHYGTERATAGRRAVPTASNFNEASQR